MRFLPNGIAIPSKDTHLGHWVETQNKLCCDPRVDMFIETYVHPGHVVVDGGANIGDHTIAYCEAVGPSGTVYAFEPNNEALACCAINCRSAICIGMALWHSNEMLPFNIVDGNVGMSHIDLTGAQHNVMGISLDTLNLNRLDILKLDIEGCEYDALVGAIDTIERCRPVIVAEINHIALNRCNRSYQEICDLILPRGYSMELWDKACGPSGSQADVIFIPE